MGALAQTSAESYSFSLDTKVQFAGQEINSDVVSGAFDLRHDLGLELLTTSSAGRPVRTQIRFVGKYVYTLVSPGSGLGTIGKPWDESPIPAAATGQTPEGDPYGFVSDRPVDPAELSVVLASAGTVLASGPDSTGTKYAFTSRLSGRESISGTVYVDQQGRVRRLVTITTEKTRRAADKELTTDRDFTFGDFGAPVLVSAPPASKVKYTIMPYWGFYF